MNSLKAFLLNTPELGALIFIFAAVLSALICYGVARILLRPCIAKDSELFSAKIIARLGALHALILALMFAQEMADYRDISRIVSKEASAIGDVYVLLQDYDEENPQSTAAISYLIIDYVKTVLEVDRTAIAESKQNNLTWIDYHRINRQLRDLQPTNELQQDLRAQMLADWDTVSEFHMRLRTIAEYEAPSFFWVVITTGFLAVVIPFYVYSPNISNLVTLSTFAAFNGFVMYVIFSITNPFTGPLAIDSTTLTDMLAVLGSIER